MFASSLDRIQTACESRAIGLWLKCTASVARNETVRCVTCRKQPKRWWVPYSFVVFSIPQSHNTGGRFICHCSKQFFRFTFFFVFGTFRPLLISVFKKTYTYLILMNLRRHCHYLIAVVHPSLYSVSYLHILSFCIECIILSSRNSSCCRNCQTIYLTLTL